MAELTRLQRNGILLEVDCTVPLRAARQAWTSVIVLHS
jgi:hypothetical protein